MYKNSEKKGWVLYDCIEFVNLRTHKVWRSLYSLSPCVGPVPVDLERKEELQEERGLPQLETRLQHSPVHVRSPQVWTLTGKDTSVALVTHSFTHLLSLRPLFSQRSLHLLVLSKK